MSELNLTKAEWMQELDSVRHVTREIELTNEQIEFLKYARSGEKPVSYRNIAAVWSKRWGKISDTSIQNYWAKIERGI